MNDSKGGQILWADEMGLTQRAQSIKIESVWEISSTHTKIKRTEAKNKTYCSQSMQA